MKKNMAATLLTAASVVLCAVPLHAQARLDGAFTQSFQLSSDSDDPALTSVTEVQATATVEDNLSRLSVSSGLSFSFDTDGTAEFTRPTFNLNYTQISKRTRFSGGLSYSRGPTAFSEELPDLTVLAFDTTRTVIGANAELSQDLDSTTTANLRFGYTDTDFNPVLGSLAPTRHFMMSGGFNRQINATTSGAVDLSLGYLLGDNATESKSFSAELGVSGTREINNTASLDANLGVSFINTSEIQGFLRIDEWSTSLTFGAGLTRGLPDGSLGLSVSQDVIPASDGTFALSSIVNGSWSQAVNNRSSVQIAASLSRQASLGSGVTETYLILSPSYSIQLTPDISASAGLTLQRDNDGDVSQALSLTLARPFSFPLN